MHRCKENSYYKPWFNPSDGCLAVDFDQTLTTLHASDKTTLEDLIKYKRKPVCDYVQKFITHGFPVGIVTYNTRRELIISFCVEVFGKELPIESGLPTSAANGKEEHIERLYPGDVPPDKITLIDDSLNNIQVAKKRGHRVKHVPAEF